MGTIDKINQLKKEGLDDDNISDRLIDEGLSPKEIRDAFDQIKIKKAVSSENNQELNFTENNMEEYTQNQGEIPQTEDYYYPQNNDNSAPMQNPNSSNQEYYSPQNYSEDYSQQNTFDASTIIEIAEQVFTEKTTKIEKQLDKLNEFMKLSETRIANNDERIKRIEKIIDNLQIKILEKISSYGDNIDSIKKEMSMMQDSFSKTLPELVEKHEEHKRKK